MAGDETGFGTQDIEASSSKRLMRVYLEDGHPLLRGGLLSARVEHLTPPAAVTVQQHDHMQTRGTKKGVKEGGGGGRDMEGIT